MAKHMSAELLRIRDNLTCNHCGSTFQGSDSQASKVKYEQRQVYCSTACRHAHLRKCFSTPVPNRGPCKTCGQVFFSRSAKLYCCIDCYVKSDQFKAMIQDNIVKITAPESRQKTAESLRKGEWVPCPECGEEVYQKPWQKKKNKHRFCNQTCYRSYLAKRFDRWIANPEGMALPQCYDEFLDRQVLSCVVDGCDWRGRHLTLHMNQAHGVKSDEFKRATGFNLTTGVIAKPLALLLQQRPLQGVAIDHSLQDTAIALSVRNRNYVRYTSAEGREHYLKSLALKLAVAGPERACIGCGVVFRQRTSIGRTLYCTPTCRDATYATRRKKPAAV